MEAFGAYGRALQEAGVLLSGDVLQPTGATTTVTRRDGGLRVQDGPFAETKEALAGIFVLEVADLDAAIGWAEKCPGAQWGVIEVRPSATALGQRRVDALTPFGGRWRRGPRDAGQRFERRAWRPGTVTGGCSRSCPPRPAISPPPKTRSRTRSSAPCARGPRRGRLASPDAWLLTVARNRLRLLLEVLAQAQRTFPLDGRSGLARLLTDDLDVDALPDLRLELMLVCAHPAIEPAAHTPLMLSTVLGFTAEQIGRAFSVPTSTMATCLVRAKKRIKAARVPFRIPGSDELPARMAAVLEAVYGAYVIDWATTGPQARHLPPSEALHLAEVLASVRARRPGGARARRPRPALGVALPPPAWTRGRVSSRCPTRTRRGGTRA